MDEDDHPPEPPIPDAVADLVARYILALELDGRDAAERLLSAEPQLAPAARAHVESLARAGMLREPDDRPPECVGRYRILERLGRGGMGEVYLAEQREPVRRRVALKIIRPGMDSREVLARFAVERQALALLDHPNIAKIHDAGETEEGRPFIAMEYVSGVPITAYCDDRELRTDERLELFATVCDTVQHAHQRGILHRDLKPSNVLVTDQGGRPWPTIIDFGVAKSTQTRLAIDTLHTGLGRVLGTPEYMSPEQAANRVDVDTRTDVYSLGVLLYELLTGHLPIDSKRLREPGEGGMERVLLREEPPTPSTRVSTLGEDARGIAERRGTDPVELRRRLRGELDWITMRALEKDRNRRYSMPAELAADLRRHLAHEPVAAGPPGSWYRFSRFARRHRSAVAAAGGVLLALILGLVLSVSFWRQARAAQRQESTARAAAEHALEVALEAADRMLVEVGGAGLRRFPGLAADRRRMLESGLEFCRSVLDDGAAGPRTTLASARVRTRVAWFLLELDAPRDALRVLDEIRLPGADETVTDLDVLELTATAEDVRARACLVLGSLDGAVAARRRQLAAASRARALRPKDTLLHDREALALGSLGRALLRTDPNGAEVDAVFDAACAATRRAALRDGDPSPLLAELLRTWAAAAGRELGRGHPDAAHRLLEELEIQIERLLAHTPDDPDLLEQLAPTLEKKARTLQAAGEMERSEAASREAVAVRERLAARFPDDTQQLAALATSRSDLATGLSNAFRYRESLDLVRSAVATQRAVVAKVEDSPGARLEFARILGQLALITIDYRRLRGDLPLDEAHAACAEAVDILDGLGAGESVEHHPRFVLASVLFAAGQLAELAGDIPRQLEANRRCVEVQEGLVRDFPDQVRSRLTLGLSLRRFGIALLDHGDPRMARDALERAVAIEDALRDEGVAYQDSDSRLTAALFALARAEAATAAIDAARAAVARAVATAPDRQIIHFEASALLLDIADAAEDEAVRASILSDARSRIEAAHDLLRGYGPAADGPAGASQLVTELRILEQRAAIEDARGDAAGRRESLRDALDVARKLAGLRDREDERTRMAAILDGLIELARAAGDDADLDRLTAERAAVRSR